MNIIKLNATDSTNSYLKKMVEEMVVDSFTIVVAEHQKKGRGQMGTSWESEVGKNLIFSVLIKFSNFEIAQQFYLSMAISLAVLHTLKKTIKTELHIKWPNDILADNNKLSGILIENSLKGNLIKQSIVGIGLNVNQQKFSKNIKNVTSLKNIVGKIFDRDALLIELVKSIEYYIDFIKKKEFLSLKQRYLKSLYKFQIPTLFEDNFGAIFLGKIIDVSEDGRLILEIEDKKTHKFNLKEIKFASL